MPLHFPSLPQLLFLPLNFAVISSFASIFLCFPLSHPQTRQTTGLTGNIHGNQPWKNNKWCSQTLHTSTLLNHIPNFLSFLKFLEFLLSIWQVVFSQGNMMKFVGDSKRGLKGRFPHSLRWRTFDVEVQCVTYSLWKKGGGMVTCGSLSQGVTARRGQRQRGQRQKQKAYSLLDVKCKY